MTLKPNASLHGALAAMLLTFAVVNVATEKSMAADADALTVLRGVEAGTLSYTQDLSPASAGEAQFLEFQFGFSTDEEIVPATFLDSVTFTLEGVASGNFAAFVTVDRSGSYWAPAITGGLTLDPTSIERQAISFPDEVTPSHAHEFAYFVRAQIPTELRGESLQFHMDLFSNDNGVQSLAWVGPAVVVPEPSSALILLIGAIFYFGFKWRAR
jgi:hypothetical protein